MKNMSTIVSKLGGILAILAAISIFLLDADNDAIFKNIFVCVAVFGFGSLVYFLFYDTKRTNALFIAAAAMLVHIWYKIHRNVILIGAAADAYRNSSSTSEREFAKRVYHNTVIYNLEHEDDE